jgi:acyl transferase domain-containing protein
LEGASGILGVVKAIMMIQRGCILPNAGFEEFNRNIEGREKLKVCAHPLATIIGDER